MTRSHAVLRSALIALSLTALAGCKTGENCSPTPASGYKAMGIVNGHCPMMPDEGVNGTTIVMHGNQKVGMCCQGCVKKWNALSDADKAGRLSRVIDK